MSDISGLDDDVRAVLRELVTSTGAISARIILDDDLRTGVPARTLALGGGEFLRVELGSTSSGETPIEAAFEHATRQLRAIRRRWEVARLPEVHVGPGAAPTVDKVTERIATYVKALAQIDRATNAFLVKAGKGGTAARLIASGTPPDEQESSRWQFLARRVLNTHAPNSSHGEVVDPDAYAMSFWYDCALLVFLAEPFGVDFVRHRCKQVARELANLLPLLEPDPEAPAAIRRRPPTLP
ncbi:MAG: hypothetical protein ACKV2T_38875 [Kofleriaceae bacterium]